MNNFDSDVFEKELKAYIKGEVSFDEVTLQVYSTDASIYQIKPKAIVVPRDESDVVNAVKTAADHNVSILPRGGGTSLGGQAVGSSMIIDFTKYMNNIIELNVEERWVRVQPGIVLDELNATLSAHGLFFAPDPATSSRATIGGMMGNNSSGAKSIVYGLTRDHVIESRFLLPDGEILNLTEKTAAEYNKTVSTANESARETEIYKGFKSIIESNRENIRDSFPKTMRRVQGYSLDLFANNDDWNLTNLIIGSEGTLGVILDVKLNLVPLPRHKILCVVHFNKLLDAIDAVEPMLEYSPSAVELMDNKVMSLAKQNYAIAPLCAVFEGVPESVLIVEFFGDTIEETEKKASHFAAEMRQKGIGYAWPVITPPEKQAEVWSIRKNGLGLLLGMKSERKPIPFIEDCCVPVKILPEYIDRILKYCEKLDIDVTIYAHASVGTIHVRPVLNMKVRQDIDMMKSIASFALSLIKEYGGAWSGEHGDGRVRSPFLEEFFGTSVYQSLRKVKNLFDPRGLMNPGVIVDANPMDQDLRYGEKYVTPTLSTEYHYLEDGTISAAVELCNGVGACRQTLTGTMCPSFRATRDEAHSTRGRANALRLALSGQLGPDGITNDSVHKVFDLCLSCKGCKSDCPSSVDIARLKSEYLRIYRERKGTTLRDRMVAASPAMSAVFSGWIAPIFNFVQGNILFRKLLELTTGFDSRRVAPAYSSTTFAGQLKRRNSTIKGTGKQVVLFDDTYMKYHEPNIGISAVELLESCGYEVILAEAGCCQRPKISHGFLKEAKAGGEKTIRNIDVFLRKGLRVVVCEPGCFSSLVDDLPDLIGDRELAGRLRDGVMMIDSFIAEELKSGRLKRSFASRFEKILVHGHCHQKALSGTTSMTDILGYIQGVDVEEISSGCCGMAGSFGYEKEHYDMSMKVGNEVLFPKIKERGNDTAVVACGFSCRHQIADGTGVRPLHWVETLRAVEE